MSTLPNEGPSQAAAPPASMLRSSIPDAYTLHSSDHPGLILVSQPLQEDNYASWCRSMRLALSEKCKIGFIDGSLPKPDPALDPVLVETWQCTNDIVTTWLLNSISKDIAASVIYAGSAALLWQDLEARFSQSNAPRIFELKKSLMTLTQGSLTVSQYFTKLKILWEELNTFKPLVACSCGGVKVIQAYLDQEYVMLFLMGLNDNLANVRSQILLSDPLPPIGKVFSLVLQEEKQKALTSSQPPQHMAFAVKQAPRLMATSGSKMKGKKDRPQCAHCGYLGHTAEKCYKLHGYPPGYSQSRNTRQVTQVNHVDKLEPSQENQDSQPSNGFSLTASQYNQLMALLQTQQAMQAIEPEICAGQDLQEGDWQR
ncbi:uncharacterized protein LOC110266048 [Arachis ipaensis]|uniref:uncharacterized protein LOC110266048 n=1 Tax=Arachis ipaensis TaxID=130454 RepID=UPI000A2B8941|nr:uncharacterized protein LOC110266048 [Arachis ipaensis]XP_025672689.1 uncharacterized protein LOC112772025 [Arachis hypogaea]